MGLNVSHHAFHGSCTEFNMMRAALARAAGYPVTPQPGPDGRLTLQQLADADWETPGYEVTDARPQGDWSGEPLPEDPLLVLLLHSDLAGGIAPDYAGSIAERIETLIPLIGASNPEDEAVLSRPAERFAAGLRTAAANGEYLEFD